MKRYVLVVAILLTAFAVTGAYAQDNQQPAAQAQQSPAAVEAAAPVVSQPQEISIYGEVKAVNVAANSMTIQYYDYDSDEEKTIEITADKDTKLENATTIGDVKQGNWADVIYTASSGKNIAKSIIIEKEEEAPAEMPKAEETPPAPPQPQQQQ